ncbi:MAG: DUF2017 family protein [Actinobacteria bacterium]|nr:DUF2017 family protein [Actinomycetota bacterium]
MSHFKTTRRGIEASFSDAERTFLGDVIPLLEGLGPTGDDPAAARLTVPVYLDDPVANEEWWRLMGTDLEMAREADRGVFSTVIGSRQPVVLDDADADAVLRVLNEARLVLGARLGIEVEDDHERVPPEERAALDYLGWVEEELIDELTRRL